MEMYNEIYVDCPKCEYSVRFQTKSGSCQLKSYNIKNCPEREFIGIIGDMECCSNCWHVVKILDPNGEVCQDFSSNVI